MDTTATCGERDFSGLANSKFVDTSTWEQIMLVLEDSEENEGSCQLRVAANPFC